MKHKKFWKRPGHWPHPPGSSWGHDHDPPWGPHDPPWGPHKAPWGAWDRHHKFRGWPPPWRRNRGLLFLRFAGAFGFMVVLVLGGMLALALVLNRLFGGDGQAAVLVWFGGCGLALALPLLAVALAVRTFRGIAMPLADVMTAADAIAEGDLSVRVPAQGPGEFSRLAESFNRMAQELEHADQERRNLTADVAHELRTPLHIIQGNLEGVLDGVYDPTAEHIGTTLDETRSLARLVDDLRTLSLAEAGQLPMVWEQVDVAELLADVSTSFSGQAEVAGVELHVEPARTATGLQTQASPSNRVDADPALMEITADAGRLDQVLSNLLANALRHTPPGGAITLRAEPIDGGVRITVSDTGEGIPPEDLPYIFDRFWRGDRSRSRTEGTGSGLGLPIARQLVQAHGGRITAESQPGQGTIMTIELPVGEKPA